jgi:hypothetical protein
MSLGMKVRIRFTVLASALKIAVPQFCIISLLLSFSISSALQKRWKGSAFFPSTLRERGGVELHRQAKCSCTRRNETVFYPFSNYTLCSHKKSQ